MFSTPHFVTGDYKSPGRFLPTDEYGRALDCLVKACTDIMIVNPKGEVLLGKRKVYPQPDWWIIGGRMRPGETVHHSIQRLLARELRFKLQESDFGKVRTVAHYTYCFSMRNEEPQANGNADLAAILTLDVSQDEADSFALWAWVQAENLVWRRIFCSVGNQSPLYFDPNEYEAICWVKPEDILKDSFGSSVPQLCSSTSSLSSSPINNPNFQFHPALKRASRDLLAMKVWDNIERVNSGEKEGDVKELLSSFILLKSNKPLN